MNQNNAHAHTLLELEREFEAGDNKEYEVKLVINSAVYDKTIENQLSSLDYLVLWKGNPKEENT